MCVLLLGVDKTKITPQHRIYLAGYADREDVFEEVIHDLYVRTFYFRQGNIDKLIVQGNPYTFRATNQLFVYRLFRYRRCKVSFFFRTASR
ncbi:MAG: hypothetical protein PWP27_2757 [Clostridiales bacterium]|nr:hypothetical protein [Clostridiales bacterium]